MSRARAAITSGIVALALVGAWFVGRGDVASVDESPAGDREAPGAIDPARPEAALAGHGRAKPAVGAPAARRVLGTPKPVEGASIRGIVVDGAGVAVAGARVVAIPDTATRFLAMEAVGAEGGTGAENFTDAQGRFVVAAVGDAPLYALVAQADGYGLVSVPDVPVGADVSVTLVAARRLHGRVLTIDGEPIAGAEVAVRVTVRHVVVERATTSAADGAYALDGLPADADPFGRFVDVRAVKAGFAPLQVRSLGRADPHDPDAFEQHLVLVRGATVVGVVVDDETGRPVPDARVVVWAPARVRALERRGGFLDEDPFGGVVLGTTATAPDGTFRLPHLPATGFHPVPWTDGRRGRVLGYVAARRAETTWGLAEVPVPADGATVEIEGRVRPAASVVGRVVAAAGRAVAG
ncbi:MAG: carboxypeptidase regulatory-like domain-containing protein, partial [Planctomycetia bacterium]|nr:carboxypeptidase regulatory-like domain-containing protein [Planctomycetia bacterium]